MTTIIILTNTTFLLMIKRFNKRYEGGLATFNPETKKWSVPIDNFTKEILDVYRHEDETYEDCITRALHTTHGLN